MRFRSPAFLAFAVSLALPSAVLAQGRDVYKLPVPSGMMGSQMGRAQPGVAASSPIGFGPSAGDIFVGFGLQTKQPNSDDADGAISVGGGFLNPNETVGIEAVLTSFSTIRGGIGQRMGLSAKVHKNVNGWGLGLGTEGIILNGDDFGTSPTLYVAATRGLTVRDAATFNSATINFGVGTGRFQSVDDFAAGESGLGVFFSSSLRVNEWSSAIVDYAGAQLTLGLSFAPFKNLPLVISPALSDITGASGSNAARPSLGAGLSWKY